MKLEKTIEVKLTLTLRDDLAKSKQTGMVKEFEKALRSKGLDSWSIVEDLSEAGQRRNLAHGPDWELIQEDRHE